MNKKAIYLSIAIVASVVSFLLYKLTSLEKLKYSNGILTVRYKAGLFFGTKTFDFNGGWPGSYTLPNGYTIEAVNMGNNGSSNYISLSNADGTVKQRLII